MGGHSLVSLGARHPVHNYVYANAGARLAATGFVSADVGKVAYQTDTQTLWALVDDSPITWLELGGGGSASPWGPTQVEGWEIREPFVCSQARSHYTGTLDPSGGDAYDLASPGTAPEYVGVVWQYRDSTGVAYLSNVSGSGGQIVFPATADGLYTMDWVFQLEQLATASDDFWTEDGLAFDSHLDYTGNEYITVRYHRSENSGRFRLKYANGGGASYVDSGVTVAADTWYYCRLECTQEEVRLYIDTAENTRTLRATINSGFPTDEIGLTIFSKLTALAAPALVLRKVDDIHEKYERF